ncbi:heme oxygenase [Rhodoligotrophos appendicifer]
MTTMHRSKEEGFRFVLRRETRSDHEALDDHPAFRALLDGTLSPEAYLQLMTVLYELYHALDDALGEACERFSSATEGFAYAPRTPVLSSDLRALGLDPEDWDGQGQVTHPALPTAASLAGMLYVVEGSLLGGAVLHRATEALPNQVHSGGNSYWRWCGEVGGKRWAMTCRLLEHLASDPERRSEMIGSAVSGFQLFSRNFARCAVGRTMGTEASC